MNRRVTFVLIAALITASLLTGALTSTMAQEGPIRIIFMHHSTGQGVIEQGGVRDAFADLGYEFWDHGYNGDGLADPSGEPTGENWDVPGDNTDPDGWQVIFGQDVTDPPENTFSHMLTFDVIIFKSCFPTSDIQSDEQFENYVLYFSDIRDAIDAHPDRLFIAFTTPPLTPNSTTPEAAARARQWSEYLTSDEYLEGHPNLVVFNFFDLLADEDNFLRADYRPEDEYDSHPNELANGTVGPIFVDFVDQAIREFVPGEAPGAATATNLIDDFESDGFAEDWSWTARDGNVTDGECTVGEPGYESQQAMQFTFVSERGLTASCLTHVNRRELPWMNAAGISFFWRADTPSLPVRVVFDLISLVPDGGLRQFVVPLETPAVTHVWESVVVHWDDILDSDTYGETRNDFDPQQIIVLIFEAGISEERQGGTIWIDDIQIVTQAQETDEPDPEPLTENGALIEDFEDVDFETVWWTYVNDETATEFECTLGGPGYSGESTLQLTFEAGGWNTAGCGGDYDSGEAWAAADGVSFFWQADEPALAVNVAFLVDDPAHPDEGDTPFEVLLETPGRAWEWEMVTVRWDDLTKPDWFGDEGVDSFDPANVRAILFEVGNVEEMQSGTIWIDDVRLAIRGE